MEKMESSLEAVKRSFATVRTGRATPAMLDRVEVDYYGAMTPLKTIAGVSAPDARTVVVQPYDQGALQAIEKAIMSSDLGLTPSNDGKLIRINVPALTQERRKDLTKTVAKLSEEGKVAIRNVRRDAIKQADKLGKDKVLSEDAAKDLEVTIQELTDDYVKQVEKLAKGKSDELTQL